MARSVMKIYHPTSVRSLVFSPSLSHPLQAVVGLDNGSIYRWNLKMGQRGQLDRLPVAHAGTILALDWCGTPGPYRRADGAGALMDRSWIVSGGLDHTVKVCTFRAVRHAYDA
jgi:WD40 repeat protein